MNNMMGQADYYISNGQHASGLTQEPEYPSDSEVAKPDRNIGTLHGRIKAQYARDLATEEQQYNFLLNRFKTPVVLEQTLLQ